LRTIERPRWSGSDFHAGRCGQPTLCGGGFCSAFGASFDRFYVDLCPSSSFPSTALSLFLGAEIPASLFQDPINATAL